MSRPTQNHGRHSAEAFARDWVEVAAGRLGLGITADISRRREDLLVLLKLDGRGFGHRRPVQIASALQTLLEGAMARQGFREGVEVRLAEEAGANDAEVHGLMAAVRVAAVKAAAAGRSFALGPMSVADRRQVHQAVSEIGEVWTQSEGDGIFRRLWIMPRAILASRPASPEPEPPAQG